MPGQPVATTGLRWNEAVDDSSRPALEPGSSLEPRTRVDRRVAIQRTGWSRYLEMSGDGLYQRPRSCMRALDQPGQRRGLDDSPTRGPGRTYFGRTVTISARHTSRQSPWPARQPASNWALAQIRAYLPTDRPDGRPDKALFLKPLVDHHQPGPDPSKPGLQPVRSFRPEQEDRSRERVLVQRALHMLQQGRRCCFLKSIRAFGQRTTIAKAGFMTERSCRRVFSAETISLRAGPPTSHA